MATDKCTTPAPFAIAVAAPTLAARLLWWGTLVAVFALAAYPRFARLPDRGIQGSDQFWYWACARLWSEGHPHFADTGVEFFRPVAFLLHAFALTVFGHTDWAIKALHANMDLVSVGLILAATWALSGSRWLGLAVAATFGANSRAIHAARIELVQTPSTMFLLLLYLPLLFLLRTKSTQHPRAEMGLAFAAGLCLSLSGSLHEDLYLLAPGVALGLVLPCLCGPGDRSIPSAARRIFGFSAGVMAVPVAFTIWLGPQRILAMFMSVRSVAVLPLDNASPGPDAYSGWLAWRLNDLIESVSLVLRKTSWILAAAPVAAVIALGRFSSGARWICLAALLGALGYVTLFCILLPGRLLAQDQARVFAPVIFYSLPAAWGLVSGLMDVFPRWGRRTLVALAVAGASITADGSIPYVEWLRNPDNVTRLRWLQDTLGEHLDARNRLLIAPTIAERDKLGLENAVYLGDRMVYLREAETTADSFDTVLSKERIRYVFLSARNDSSLLTADSMIKYELTEDAIGMQHIPIVLGRCFGMNRETYSVDKEAALIVEALQARGAVVFATSRHGTVYALPAEAYGGNGQGLSASDTEGRASSAESLVPPQDRADRSAAGRADAEGAE